MELLDELKEKTKQLETQLEEKREHVYRLNLQQREKSCKIDICFDNANKYNGGYGLDVTEYMRYTYDNRSQIGNIVDVINEEYPDATVRVKVGSFVITDEKCHDLASSLLTAFSKRMKERRSRDEGLDKFFKLMILYPTAKYYFDDPPVQVSAIFTWKLNLHVDTTTGEVVKKWWGP